MERVSEYLKGVYGVSEQAGGWIRKTIHETVVHFHHVDLSVHRTRLMKESHDHLLQLCSPIDKDFLNIQVPPAKPAKRKQGNFTSLP